MLGLKAFRQKPREFNYRPRYFDPEKEAREERKRELLGDDAVDGSHDDSKEYRPGQYIRSRGMRRGTMYEKHKGKTRNQWSASVRIIAIVALLAFLIWFILID